MTLFDELRPLGFSRSYPPLTRQIRARSLRPPRFACSQAAQRGNAVIAHPRVEETQLKIETGIPVFFADPQSPWQR